MGHPLLEVLLKYCPDMDIHSLDTHSVVFVFRQGEDYQWKEFLDICCRVPHPVMRTEVGIRSLANILTFCPNCPDKMEVCRSKLDSIFVTLRRALGEEGTREAVTASWTLLRREPAPQEF